MMAAAKATTKGDTFGVSMRTRVSDFAFWDWFPYIHNAGADILNKDWTANGLAGAEDAMQFLIDLHKAKVTPPVGSVDWQGQFDLFKAGKIAIYHGETPQINDLLATPAALQMGRRLRPARAEGANGDGQLRHSVGRRGEQEQGSRLGVHQTLGVGARSRPLRRRGQSPGGAHRYRQPTLRRQAGDAEDSEGVRARGSRACSRTRRS